MIIEKKDTFEPMDFWIKNVRRVEARMPMDPQHALSCLGCKESFELEAKLLRPNSLYSDDPAYTRHPLGIKCPKCGLHQAVGQMTTLSMWEVSPPSREPERLAEIATFPDYNHLFYMKVVTPEGKGKVIGWNVVFEVAYEAPTPGGATRGSYGLHELLLDPEKQPSSAAQK